VFFFFGSVNSYEYTYTGRRLDHETGLYYFRHRQLEAQLGRFISRDPIGYAGGNNLLRYVVDAPTTAADPTGTQEIRTGTVKVSWYETIEGVSPTTGYPTYNRIERFFVAQWSVPVDCGSNGDRSWFGRATIAITDMDWYSWLQLHFSGGGGMIGGFRIGYVVDYSVDIESENSEFNPCPERKIGEIEKRTFNVVFKETSNRSFAFGYYGRGGSGQTIVSTHKATFSVENVCCVCPNTNTIIPIEAPPVVAPPIGQLIPITAPPVVAPPVGQLIPITAPPVELPI